MIRNIIAPITLVWLIIIVVFLIWSNENQEKTQPIPAQLEVKNYSWRSVNCQNIDWIVTNQSWVYVYIEWTNHSYQEETRYKYNWRQHVSECWFEPIDKREELETAQERYDWIFKDDKWFACRQMVTNPIMLIQKWQCQDFTPANKEEWSWYRYECTIKIDEYSAYPVFCI